MKVEKQIIWYDWGYASGFGDQTTEQISEGVNHVISVKEKSTVVASITLSQCKCTKCDCSLGATA